MRLSLFLLLLIATPLLAKTPRSAADGPLSPADSMKQMDLVPGWTITLVASEPNVASPVAMTWDADGNLYVAEMRDYPNDTGGGTIRKLTDTNRDGVYDQSIIFADNLRYPNGLLPYRDGLLVTSAPDILYLKDTTGDGMADAREVILTGFGQGNQQLRVNGLAYGIDGWIYAANGRSGGNITSPKRKDQPPLAIDRHDLRFKPDTGEVERAAGFSQFGNVIDAWGNRFTNWNTVPFRHVVLPHDVTTLSPHYIPTNDSEVLDEPTTGNRIFPKSSRPATFNKEPPGYFNASCGLAVEKSGLFPAADAHSLFVCEPLFNIVHRRKLAYAGVTFQALRPDAEKEREFLTSTDPWFRPVYCAFGPDGSLYLADFYRQWVEHPDFVRPELREGVTWNTGKENGRIYRLQPKEMKPDTVTPMSPYSTGELLGQLDRPNTWKRETARRLLTERNDPTLTPKLIELVQNTGPNIPKLSALQILLSLGPFPDEVWQWIETVNDPTILEVALRIARSRPERPSTFIDLLRRHASSTEPRVRFEAILAAVPIPFEKRKEIIASALAGPAANHWEEQALLLAIADHPIDFFELLAESKSPSRGKLALHCAEWIGNRGTDDEDARFHITLGTQPIGGPSIIARYLTGRRNANRPYPELISGRPLAAWVKDAKQFNDETDLATKRSAILLLEHDPDPNTTADLVRYFQNDLEADEFRLAALRLLRHRPDLTIAEKLLEEFPSATPSLKREILDALFARPERLEHVIAALEEGTIAPAELDPDRQRQLAEQSTGDLKERAQKIFAHSASVDRKSVIEKVLATWPKEGNLELGAKLFAKHCAGCHRVGDIGTKVGPEIAGLINKSREQVLEEILDPNRQVLPDYVSFLVMTSDGVSLTGLLAAETTSAITLKRAEGTMETIPRASIEELRATGRSLMPEGFEQSLAPKDFADLVAFLRGTP